MIAPPKDAQKAFADYWPYGISDDIDVFKRDVYDAWCAAWRAATAAAHEADAKLAESHLSTRYDTAFADEVGIEDNMTRTIAAAIRSRAEEEK